MPDYVRARTLEEALAVKASRDVAVLAGGTDIYPAWATRRAWGEPAHKDVLDIGALAELRGVALGPDHWRFGALTTWRDVIEARLPAMFAGLRQAAREVGGAQVQNRGTVAGNLCTASPAGDGIPCLLALDAEVELTSLREVRRLPLAAFNIGYRRTALEPDEIVTAVLVPTRGGASRGVFLKLGARRYLVISIAMVSAVIEADPGGLILRAAVAVGACGPAAQRLPLLEAELIGQPLPLASVLVQPRHLDGLSPIDDVRASADYRRAAAGELVRDALRDIARDDWRRAA